MHYLAFVKRTVAYEYLDEKDDMSIQSAVTSLANFLIKNVIVFFLVLISRVI